MTAKARDLDKTGDYRLVKNDEFNSLEAGSYNLILSAFAFDHTGWRARPFTQKLELLLLRRASPKPPNRSDLPGLFPSAEELIAAVRLKP